MHSIFLSHSSKDRAFAIRLGKDLAQAGVRVWVHEAEMLPGDSLIQLLGRAIGRTTYLGVILSPDSVRSRWVQKEVEIALLEEIKGKRVKVIPILYRDCRIPPFLATRVWAEFSQPRSYRKGLDALLRRLGEDRLRRVFEPTIQPFRHISRPIRWSPKLLRLGSKHGLLQQRDGIVDLSAPYVETICRQAQKMVKSPRAFAAPDAWMHLQVVAAADAMSTPAYEDDFVYLVSKLSGPPLLRYMLDVAASARIITITGDRFDTSADFISEFFAELDRALINGEIRTQPQAAKFAITLLRDLAQARLFLRSPAKLNHASFLAMAFYCTFNYGNAVREALPRYAPWRR